MTVTGFREADAFRPAATSWQGLLGMAPRVLAELVKESETIERYAEVAGLNDFAVGDSTPVNAWHRALREARHQGLLHDLLDGPAEDYPRHPELKRIVAMATALSTDATTEQRTASAFGQIPPANASPTGRGLPRRSAPAGSGPPRACW